MNQHYVFTIATVHKGKEYFLSQFTVSTGEKVWSTNKLKGLAWDNANDAEKVIRAHKWDAVRVKGIIIPT